MYAAVSSSMPSGRLTVMPYWSVNESGPVGMWQLMRMTSVWKPL